MARADRRLVEVAAKRAVVANAGVHFAIELAVGNRYPETSLPLAEVCLQTGNLNWSPIGQKPKPTIETSSRSALRFKEQKLSAGPPTNTKLIMRAEAWRVLKTSNMLF